MELDEAMKDRIRLEETYRAEMRATLAEQQAGKKRKSVWDWVNAPITLWALSSVVVGIFGAIYTSHSESQKARADEQAYIERIITELRDRTGWILRQTVGLHSFRELREKRGLQFDNWLNPPFLFNEFQNRKYESFIRELTIVCHSLNIVHDNAYEMSAIATIEAVQDKEDQFDLAVAMFSNIAGRLKELSFQVNHCDRRSPSDELGEPEWYGDKRCSWSEALWSISKLLCAMRIQ